MVRVTLVWIALAAPVAPQAEEGDYYRLATFPFAEARPLEVTGLTCLRDGRVMVATRLGDVFVIDGAYGDPANASFTRWARGLAQPMGLLELDGAIWTAQRGELTRMQDTDGDGRADRFDTVCDAWEISGNYHEYNFGPRLDPDGKLWVTLNKPFGDEPFGKAHWRGWAVRIDPATGAMEPMAVGLRSPAGIEVAPWGDVFFTDNQGEWCNAGKLAWLRFGDFHGHPHGLRSKDLAGEPFASIAEPESGTWMKDLGQQVPAFRMPAVWFPFTKAGQSPAGMAWDRSDGAFGPFAGQVFVGDQHHAALMRVDLEQVGGHWQGACFPFREGFDCGIVRVAQGHDGSLFVGMTNAGWGSRGTRPWGLQRVVWTGAVPFEIHSMRARPDGFALAFTRPVDPASVARPGAFRIESYTYKLESRYGGPEDDKLECGIEVADVDGTNVRLRVTPLRAGYVHELRADGLVAADGAPLLHEEAFYTLVNVPER
jgi:glucose/arabinose dehydrogenase